MRMRKIYALLLCTTIFISGISVAAADVTAEEDFGVFEETYDLDSNLVFEPVENYTPAAVERKIFDNDEEVEITEPILTGYIYDKAEHKLANSRSWGVGSPVAKIFTYRSSSNGVIRRGSKVGTYVSIAATLLPFIRDWKISVQALFAVTGMAASSTTYSQGETYTSSTYYVKEAKARWSSDPDNESYYHLAFRAGREDVYKHVMSAVRNESTQRWTTKWYDYPSASETNKTSKYENESYMLSWARSYLDGISSFYDETWW